MFASQLTLLYKTADEVGADVNNPEGGLTLDTPHHDIVEIIVDISKLEIDPDELTERQRERILDCFYMAARRTSKQGD